MTPGRNKLYTVFPFKKLNLDRFKKSTDGLIEFAAILEQASPEDRERIMGQVREQDPDFLIMAMRKAVFFEELTYLSEGILAEVLSKTSPKVLAFAIHGESVAFRQVFLRHLGLKEIKELKDEEEKMKVIPSAGFKLGARAQVLEVGRRLEREGKIVFELDDCPRLTPKRKRRAMK